MTSKFNSNQIVIRLIFVLLIFFYSASHFYWFTNTSLGMTPVLDGAENILLADNIYKNELAQEPFYRAMLYPAFLSLFRHMGVEKAQLHYIASISGVIFHVINSLLVAWLAMLVWKSKKSYLIALLIYGMYPLAIYFAVDPLDITLGIMFMLLSVNLFLTSLAKNESKYACFAGIFLSLSILTRPNVVPVVMLFVFALLSKIHRKKALLSISFVFAVLLLAGCVNYVRSGEFRLLPWQGAYGLYVSNCTKANGKYFSQTILLPDRMVGKNPARLESEMIYQKATNRSNDKSNVFSISNFNSFWRQKTFHEIYSDPARWIKLEVKKLYYIANNFEQYNNKTFLFHKRLSPILRYNPLCWGIILILTVITLFNIKKFSLNLNLCLTAVFFLSLGLLLFIVSARFRILLLPFMIVFASGIINLNKLFRPKNFLIFLVVFTITFSSLFEVNDTSTFVSDYLLMAHSNARIFNYDKQLEWSEKVLSVNPYNVEAMKIQLNAFLNLVLHLKISNENEWNRIVPSLRFLDAKNMMFSDTAFLSGCYAWKFKNDGDRASSIWKVGLSKFEPKSLFAAVLLLTNQLEEAGMTEISPLLWYALVKSGRIKSDDSVKYNKMKKVENFLLTPVKGSGY